MKSDPNLLLFMYNIYVQQKRKVIAMKKNQIKIFIMDGSGSITRQEGKQLNEQMVLERLGNKNGQVFYNQ